MRAIQSFIRLQVVPVMGFMAVSASVAAAEPWWQRIEGHASAGIAAVKATPDTGGLITLSFNDSDTAANPDKAITAGKGLQTKHTLPQLNIGARIEVMDDLTVGIDAQYYEFGDAISTVPADRPGVPPQTNFATYTEDSQFKLRATDFAATLGYSRWGGSAELLAGYRDAYFRARAQLYTFGVFTTGNFVNLMLQNGSLWEGNGPRAGLRLSWQIPNLPLQVIARYSYSHLDGKSDSFARSAGSIASSPSAPLVGAATVTRADADSKMKIHDQEYGLQYDLPGTLAWARLSWMQTKWTIDGPPTGGAGFGGTIGTLSTNSFSQGGLGGGKLSGTMLTLGLKF